MNESNDIPCAAVHTQVSFEFRTRQSVIHLWHLNVLRNFGRKFLEQTCLYLLEPRERGENLSFSHWWSRNYGRRLLGMYLLPAVFWIYSVRIRQLVNPFVSLNPTNVLPYYSKEDEEEEEEEWCCFSFSSSSFCSHIQYSDISVRKMQLRKRRTIPFSSPFRLEIAYNCTIEITAWWYSETCAERSNNSYFDKAFEIYF